jgi:sulfatase maturation enzyme AslB (radical SAM superfamily)
MHTNGSARPAEWWESLARVVTACRFSIDGLSDTNHIYRRGTDWAHIMQSVEAFRRAGGTAEWDFLVFRHNEHQVEHARTLSRKLGFTRFNVKKSNRFFRGAASEDAALDAGPRQIVELPANPAYRNGALSVLQEMVRARSFTEYLNTTAIDCKAAASRGIYVSAEGLVFPCCWMANLYRTDAGIAEQIGTMLESLPEGKDSVSALRHSIQEIVEGAFFQDLVPSSWVQGEVSGGRLTVCAYTCGTRDCVSAQTAAVAAGADL